MNHNLQWITTALVTTLVLSACGGGGSGGGGGTVPGQNPAPGTVSLTGIAAAGAPILGTVSARDSVGKLFGPAAINANGTYSLNVTNGKAPFIVQATGTVGGNIATYYSAAPVGVTVANITPFTNMVVAQAASQSPDVLFTSCVPAACTQPSTAALTTAQTNINGSISNLLTAFKVPANTNLLTSTFTAGNVTGQSPIDVLLDAITVTPVTATPTSFTITANPVVTTLPANTVLLTVPVAATSTPQLVNAALTPAIVTSTQTNVANTTTAMTAIAANLTALQNLFSTAKPLPTDPALLALFDANFLMDGDNAATFATNITSANGLPVGTTFNAPVAVVSPDGLFPNDATHQWFQTALSGHANGGYKMINLAIKTAGTWKGAGNQRMASVGLSPNANQKINIGVAPTYTSSMDFWFNQGSGNGVSDATLLAAGYSSVTVSGPGVIGAASGVPGPVSIFDALAVKPGTQWIQPCGLVVISKCVDATKVVPGQYVFTIKGTTPAAAPAVGTPFTYVYKETNSILPPAAATLTTANFPTITSSTPLNMAGITSGATVSVTWTVPAGQYATGHGWYGSDNLGTVLFNPWTNTTNTQSLLATQTSTTTLPAFVGTLGWVNVTVGSRGVDGVNYNTNKQL